MSRRQRIPQIQQIQAQQVELQDAGDNLRQTQEMIAGPPGTEKVPESDEDGEAKFGTSAAVITGILASSVLGPFGLLLGIAQGWSVKQARQTELDRIRDQHDALSPTGNIMRERFNGLRSGATTPEAHAQLDGVETGLDIADKLMGNVNTIDGGMQWFDKLDSTMTEIERTNEVQKIAADATKASNIRQDGINMVQTVDGKRNRYEPVSATYRKTAGFYNGLIAAFGAEDFSGADAYSAGINFVKIHDPDSVTTGGELKNVTNLGTAGEQFISSLKGLANGEELTPTQRTEAMRSAGRLMQLKKEEMLRVDAKFKDELMDANAPTKYHNDFTTDVPLLPPSVIPEIPAGAPAEITQAGRTMSSALTSQVQQQVTAADLARPQQGPAEATVLDRFNERFKGISGVRRTN